ncbi:beta-1,6-N-acetylglucosaminyltransferase [Cognatishimia maritima]|uniref:Peptide O-xylosyltransferase n=1 Tax=Cognatishimia maritima TaxID=870908 RepID=A0A1M5P5U4_9RHOB|nr:beta-1,6-N-acetylglucosaminyltransferase [Cognatishimia maritima]SHG97128.1 Core-2/I-Branching enzyme [Cognatishimia maritima]
MTLGVVMLVHTALDRAAQVAKHWAAAECPVVIHVDAKLDRKTFEAFKAQFKDAPRIRFSKRHKCEWGMWGLVAATLSASERLLRDFPEVGHVYLASGSCLPLRPVKELVSYLEARPQTDFIESATIADVPWTVGGLNEERFALRFPFSWQSQRYWFDKYVDLQRRLGFSRKIPKGIEPHMGSQWWCLSRATLTAILQDPERPAFDRYFKRVWIPDESYFQTLVRRHSETVESRSLTLSKFDHQGKPHIFYDDHLQLLRRSHCFVARKIWPGANRLYDAFLSKDAAAPTIAEPDPTKIDRIFAKALERRTIGRAGLYMQSRFLDQHWENGVTAGPYSVFQGFSDVFDGFEDWLARVSGCRVHGHLFAPDRAEFADQDTAANGVLTDNAKLRDYNSQAFLTNLVWNTRGQRQCYQYGPGDSQANNWLMAKDANAQISVISGAWAIPLFKSKRDFAEVRKEAAALQKTESEFLDVLRSPWAKARIRIWTLAEFVEAPMEPMQAIVDEISVHGPRRLSEAPRMIDLTGFGQFLQDLRNQGMHPNVMGDFPVETDTPSAPAPQQRPYLVK